MPGKRGFFWKAGLRTSTRPSRWMVHLEQEKRSGWEAAAGSQVTRLCRSAWRGCTHSDAHFLLVLLLLLECSCCKSMEGDRVPRSGGPDLLKGLPLEGALLPWATGLPAAGGGARPLRPPRSWGTDAVLSQELAMRKAGLKESLWRGRHRHVPSARLQGPEL